MNRVRVWPGLYGGWLVAVDIGDDELIRASRNGTDNTLHHERDTAVRAARRIGKALNLPVEVE